MSDCEFLRLPNLAEAPLVSRTSGQSKTASRNWVLNLTSKESKNTKPLAGPPFFAKLSIIFVIYANFSPAASGPRRVSSSERVARQKRRMVPDALSDGLIFACKIEFLFHFVEIQAHM